MRMINQDEQRSDSGICKVFPGTGVSLIAYAYQIVKDCEEARDQVQEAFKRMIQQDEVIEKPKAWLYRTVRNLCISHMRKHRRMQKEGEEKQLDFFASQMVETNNFNNPAEKLERSEKINRVVHFVSLLPQDSKNLLKMKFDKKLSYREISNRRAHRGNVGYKLHHVIRDLADELKSEALPHEEEKWKRGYRIFIGRVR